MNRDLGASLRQQYLDLTEDEFDSLVVRIHQSPENFVEEPRSACRSVMVERGLSLRASLTRLSEAATQDANLVQSKMQKNAASRRCSTRTLGRIFGFIGIPLSLVIFGAAFSQDHPGGMGASLVFFAASCWSAFFYQGD